MRMYELVIMGIILSGCGVSVAWLLVDLFRQLKAYEERCEGLEEDEEE